MKSLFKNKFSHSLGLVFITCLFLMTSCEGLEDWTDIKGIDEILNTKKNDKNTDDFIRYSLPGLSSQPLVEYILDKSDEYSVKYNNDIRKTCDYTKIPFNSINLNDWNATHSISTTTRIICVTNTKKLDDASIPKLLEFVANGGTLFVPFAQEDHRMAYLFGFKPDADFATDVTSAGWYFASPMLPNLKQRSYFATGIHYGFATKNFKNNIKGLAFALNNRNYPTVADNKIGRGRVILFNTTIDFLKADRGFLFTGLLKGLEGVPYPIANVSTIFLDDFPAPLYNSKLEPVATEMNLSMADFVKNVWWPDMKKIAKKYKIPYSVMTTFDYRNKIDPPFTLGQWNFEKITTNNKTEILSDWFVRDAAKNSCEIAFHGYNHVSFLANNWKNPQFIGTSLNTIKKKWEISNFGNLPTTYVPPSNEIDKDGINELKKAMPSLKYMCSLYLGKLEEGGNREYDYDPYNKEFFNYPRISSGFYLNNDRRFNQESLYIYTGIWNHFVHPDDIYEISKPGQTQEEKNDLRNGEVYGWYKTKGKNKSLYTEFNSYLKEKTNTFPLMRFVTANDGARIVMKWRASRYTHKSNNGILTIKEINDEDNDGQYWMMFGKEIDKEIIENYLKNNVDIYSKTQVMDGNLYTIYTKKPEISMVDFYTQTPQEKAQQNATTKLIFEDYNKFNALAKQYQTGAIYEDHSDEIMKKEMESLKIKMVNDAVIDSVTWNKYSKYLSWNDKGKDAWQMLDEQVAKYPSKNNVMYSKELDRLIGYPNDEIKEKWMYQQMLVSPDNKDIINDYIVNFYTDDNQVKIKKALQSLLAIDNSSENQINYLKFLIQYEPQEALVEIDKINPSAEFAELATQIMWMYADNNNYQKAYDWSAFSPEIDFKTKMQWLIETRQFALLEKEYNKYIAEKPNDNQVKSIMSNVYHELGKFKDSWVLANSMSESTEKETLRKMLNKDVVYEKEELQQDLIATQVSLFYPDVLKAIVKENRLAKGDYIDFNTSLITNKADLASQEDILSYNHLDKNKNIHTFSGLYNKYYKQIYTEYYPSNYTTSLLGAQYGFKTAQKEGKPQYWSTAGILFDESATPYYQFGLGLNSSKGKRFRSVGLNFFPVETAAGVNQKIYRAQLNLYQDFYLFKVISTTISIEGDYYTDGLIGRDTIATPPEINPNRMFARNVYTPLENNLTEVSTYDDAYEGFVTMRFSWDKGNVKKSKFIPYLEGQGSLGSQNLSSGYPYWMLKDRLYGGAGLGWQLMLTNFTSRLDASYFLDTYSEEFSRFTGNVTYQLLDYTALTLNFEFFNQEKYYSNSLQFGIKYNMKKRVKK